MTTGVDAIANDAKTPVTRSSENSNFLNHFDEDFSVTT